MSLTTGPIAPAALERWIPEIARLRIAVFRAFPYLYDGDMDYEARYLAAYRESPGAVVVGAWDGGRLVGCATGTPLEDHAGEFGAPFAAAGIPLETVFYNAESVLLPEYRGRGVGHAFFDHREAHARTLGRRHAAFCAVLRPDDHPARPAGYAPLDPFWRKRGYAPMPAGRTGFSWKDVGAAAETEKPMQFWLREL
ncbi:GNAT family acetyltransferase [Paralimibaculum aggregatum]|uniref:GNAT family acetyltransferase n=1 Tax=Paralimibaculum aggregatum TaxID=3036245 RepID=A0ABQ6LSK1_9RHOB|nr:GNAT family N-acetyltransferase [Limibaculum sp. NKW23]GMG85059.1 GNAT family acetyltransferase [Limibaculum sp. NKW23]